VRPDGGGRLLLASLVALALGVSCRQTVVLDEAAGIDGGGGTAGTKDGGGGGGGTGGTGSCDSITGVPRLPELMIVLDHSNAMNPPFGSNNLSRLSAMQTEIQRVVERYQSLVWFGYEEFPTSDPTSCSNASGCCAGQPTPPSAGIDALERALTACSSGMSGTDGCAYPFDQRPMADALAQISRMFTPSNANGHHRYVLLVTGGDASCGSSTGNMACNDAMNQASTLLINSSVRTFVLGIGNDVSSSNCLDDIAQAGGEPVGGRSPFYYQATTQTDLDRDIGNIVGQQVAEDACLIIDLSSPAGDPSKVQVQIGDNFGNWTTVPPDKFNGWDFRSGSNQQITLNGQWCTALTAMQTPQIQVLSGPGCRTH
jgi:hypothetical protein